MPKKENQPTPDPQVPEQTTANQSTSDPQAPEQGTKPAPTETGNDKLAPGEEKVILVIDAEKRDIQAVKSAKKTVPFNKENESQFLKIDQTTILENFVSNLSRQYEDPKRFRILNLPMKMLDKAFELLDKLFQIVPPLNTLQFVEQHSVNQSTPQQYTTFPKEENTPAKRQYINESLINWKEIEEKFGIKRDYLERKGFLTTMLQGGKTPEAVPFTMKMENPNVIFRGSAQLSFRKGSDGLPYLSGQTANPKLIMGNTYMGHTFSKEDKINLAEKGLMGRSVYLTDAKGKKELCVIGVNPVTNKLVHSKINEEKIPFDKCGVKLEDHEREDIKDGKMVRLEKMQSQWGTEFGGKLFYSPLTGFVDIEFDKLNIFETKKLCGAEISDADLEKLAAGEVIRVNNMKTKNGDPFDRFVWLNPVNGQPEMFKYDPSSPEENREVIIPKYVSGKKLTDDEYKELATGNPTWIEGMTNRKGDPMDRYVKVDLNNGDVRYAQTIEAFHQTLDEKIEQTYEIPPVIFDHVVTGPEKAALESGKTVKMDDLKGYDGEIFTNWLKIDPSVGHIVYYDIDPDVPKERNRMDNTQNQQQGQGRGVA